MSADAQPVNGSAGKPITAVIPPRDPVMQPAQQPAHVRPVVPQSVEAQVGDTTITIKSDVIAKLTIGVWEWARGLNPVATMCFLLFAAVGVGLWHFGTVVIPGQIAEIQRSQRELAERYIEDRNRITEQYLADKRELRERHTVELNALGSRLEAIVERFEQVTASQERLIEKLIFREQKSQGGP